MPTPLAASRMKPQPRSPTQTICRELRESAPAAAPRGRPMAEAATSGCPSGEGLRSCSILIQIKAHTCAKPHKCLLSGRGATDGRSEAASRSLGGQLRSKGPAVAMIRPGGARSALCRAPREETPGWENRNCGLPCPEKRENPGSRETFARCFPRPRPPQTQLPRPMGSLAPRGEGARRLLGARVQRGHSA